MIRPKPLSRLLASAAAAIALGYASAGCGDDLFRITWFATQDTTVLYSLARSELSLPSAFDFLDRTRFVVEAPGSSDSWDVALDTRDGQLALIPPGALGINNAARITVIPDVSYDDVTEAPADSTLYSTTEPVFLELGSVYVVRTRRQSTSFGFCSVYAKLEPVALDDAVQSATFVYDNNPRCDDRALVADEERDP